MADLSSDWVVMVMGLPGAYLRALEIILVNACSIRITSQAPLIEGLSLRMSWLWASLISGSSFSLSLDIFLKEKSDIFDPAMKLQ